MVFNRVIVAAAFAWATIVQAGQGPSHIVREVRHELLLLPRLTVFDNISYRVEDSTVILSGQVTEPLLKTDAESAVKGIEGVQHVKNRIEVLPLSPSDQVLRHNLYLAIYGFDPLKHYAEAMVKPIRIIVQGRHVTLEGTADSDADRNLVGLRANNVPDVLSVTNNLRVGK